MAARPLQPPSLAHPFGTDDLGRDMLARVVWGTRVSLLVGLASAAIATLVGTAVGGCAGYAGGFADRVLMRLTDAVLILPTFILILIVVAVFGAHIGTVILIIGLTSWPQTARVARAEFLTLREREFVLAAKSGGVPDGRIMAAHVLPNALPPIAVTATLRAGTGILTEASLGFLRRQRSQRHLLGPAAARRGTGDARGLVDGPIPGRRDLPHHPGPEHRRGLAGRRAARGTVGARTRPAARRRRRASEAGGTAVLGRIIARTSAAGLTWLGGRPTVFSAKEQGEVTPLRGMLGSVDEGQAMPEIIGENVDRLCTVEMRPQGMPRGKIHRLYEAARRK